MIQQMPELQAELTYAHLLLNSIKAPKFQRSCSQSWGKIGGVVSKEILLHVTEVACFTAEKLLRFTAFNCSLELYNRFGIRFTWQVG
jgi:hypothetical protein